jgi:hypothetical protein
MTHKLLEALLVYAVVVLSAAYCLWAFLPARLKRRVAQALMARATRLQASRTLQALAQQQAGCSSGCGGCSNGAVRPGHRVSEHTIELVRHR